MWQYTTETIINSNTGNLPGNVRFGFFKPGQENAITLGEGTSLDGCTLVIDGVASLRVANIEKVYHSPWRDEKKAKAVLTVKTVNKDDVYRLEIKISEQGRVSSVMQNAYLHNTKNYRYEAQGADAPALVAAFAKAIKKDLGLTDFRFFKATPNAAVLTLDALDCYTQFDSVQLVKVGAPEGSAGQLLGFEDYVTTDATVAITPGDEGAGTVTRLVKNLRPPTSASINPFGVDFGGKPVPGGKYDQYLIEYVTDRRHVGGQVMGSYNDRSLTSHVIFINTKDTELDSAWKAVVAALGESKKEGAGKHADNENVSGDTLVSKTPSVGSVE